MPKMTVIYKAPPGDAKVTEAYGHTFHDGKPEEIEVSDEVAAKIKANPIFQPGGPPQKAEKHDDDKKHDHHDDKRK
jgi:hypothetical protein